MKDYFYETYRLIDYYDDLYGKISADIEFWVDIAKEAVQDVLELA